MLLLKPWRLTIRGRNSLQPLEPLLSENSPRSPWLLSGVLPPNSSPSQLPHTTHTHPITLDHKASVRCPWTGARQVPLSTGFSRQKYSCGLPFPSPGDLPEPGIKPKSPVWQADSLPLSHQGSPPFRPLGSFETSDNPNIVHDPKVFTWVETINNEDHWCRDCQS